MKSHTSLLLFYWIMLVSLLAFYVRSVPPSDNRSIFFFFVLLFCFLFVTCRFFSASLFRCIYIPLVIISVLLLRLLGLKNILGIDQSATNIHIAQEYAKNGVSEHVAEKLSENDSVSIRRDTQSPTPT